MAAQVIEIQDREAARGLGIVRTREESAPRSAARSPLPFPSPLLHPEAIEALLLAFRPLDWTER